jgi:hypothetical protein
MAQANPTGGACNQAEPFGWFERRQRQAQSVQRHRRVTPARIMIGGNNEHGSTCLVRQPIEKPAPAPFERLVESSCLQARPPIVNPRTCAHTQTLNKRERVAPVASTNDANAAGVSVTPVALAIRAHSSVDNPASVSIGKPVSGGAVPGSARTAKTIPNRSPAKRRATNCRTCVDSESSHWKSSIRTISGR